MTRNKMTLLLMMTVAVAGLLPVVQATTTSAQGAVAPAGGDPVMYAGGDVAQCNQVSGDEATAQLVLNEPGAGAFMLGDGAYPGGSPSDHADCYAPSWGRFRDRTVPVAGNHDYEDKTSAPGFYGYFGDRINHLSGNGAHGAPGYGYYSTEIGAWHVIVLNSNCGGMPDGCGEDTEQGRWLAADLAATTGKCVMALWHHPRFFSSGLGSGVPPVPSSDTKMSGIWRMLQAAGTDLVLGGHDHHYERFARMGLPQGGPKEGTIDPTGIRQFVVGTAGGPQQQFNPDYPAPTGSELRLDETFGLLRLVLRATSYDYDYIDVDGVIHDSGSDSCEPGVAPPTTVGDPNAPSTVTTPTTARPATPTTAPARRKSGYWMIRSDGEVYPFGDALTFGNGVPSAGSVAVDLEPTPAGAGYWTLDGSGKVRALGDAADYGSVPATALEAGEQATSLSASPDGAGYWVFTSRGRAFARGDVPKLGDMAAVRLNAPVLDSIATPTGLGYYMVAGDGGIFSFGDAKFAGSMGDRPLNAPVQSLVPDADGKGYWLVASDGGIFAFDSPFRGSMGGTRLNRPVTGMVRYADGYLMVGEDGGIFNFSSAPFAGSLGANPPTKPIVAAAALG